jgi:hypothetical protein
MATTTTNFGWDIPQSTDLVKDGATAIAALGQDIDTALIDLKGGTTGQVLAKASATDLDYSWVTTDDTNAIQNAIVDAKGDLIGATAADTPARLAVGTNGQVLTADSTAGTGLAWATPAAGGGMTSIASGSLSGSALSLTSISGSYKSLQLVLRNATPSSATDWRFKINNNTSAIYGRILMLSPGSSTFTSAAGVNQTDVAANYNSPTTSSGTTLIMNFPDYANTTSKKMIDWLMTYEKSGTSDEETLLGVVSANDNNAITRFDISLFSGTFSAGTYILYGVN